MQEKKSNSLIALISILILMSALIGYARTHKPFEATELLSVLTALYRIGIAIIIVVLAGGLGGRIRRADPDTGIVPMMKNIAIGLGVIGMIVFLFGVTVGFVKWLSLLSIVAGLILVRREIGKFLGSWKQLGFFFKDTDFSAKLIILGVIVILASNLVIALAPPNSFDGLTYHLTLPKYYLTMGQFSYVPDLMYWGMPQLTEMLFTLAMMFGGAEAAAVLEWMVGLLALTALLAFVSQKLSTKSAWMAVASLLCGWTFSDTLSRAYVEWSIILLGILFLVQADEWRTNRDTKSLLWAGLFAGLALSTKYTGGILLVAGLILIAMDRKLNFKTTIRESLIFGLTAALVTSPWLIKNLLATGNPFYPILYPAGAMDQIRLDFYNGTPVWFPWTERLIFPVLASLNGVEGGKPFNASIGPIMLGLSLLAWVSWKNLQERQKQTAKTSLVILAAGFSLWIIGSSSSRLLIQPRLYFVAFPAWALLAAYGFHGLENLRLPNLNMGRIAAILVALSLGLNAYETTNGLIQRDALKEVAGQISESKYLETNLGYYQRALEAIHRLPPDSKVLLLWETRGYYCIPICNPDETIDEFKDSIQLYQTPQNVIANWRERGYTHVLFNNIGADFIREDDLLRYNHDDWEKLDALLALLVEVEQIGDSYTIYTIPTAHP